MAKWVTLEELESLRPQWSFLENNAISRNPFFEANYLIPALKHFGHEKTNVLVVQDLNEQPDRRLVGLVPIEETPVYKLPFKTAEVWKHLHCFNSTPLLLDGIATEAWQCLVQKLRDDGFAVLSLDTVSAMPEVDTIFSDLEQALKVYRHQRSTFERPAFAPAATPQQYDQQHVSRKVRENGRRAMRRLAEQGDIQWEASDESSDFKQLADDFLSIECSGWKGKSGTALACQAETATFYKEMIQESAAESKARFLSLKLDGRPIAMISDLQSGETICSYKTCYDEAFARYSPGQQTIVKNIEHLHRDGIKLGDSCALPESSTFRRIWGQQLPFQSLLFSLAPGISRCVIQSLPMLKSAVRSLKRR